MIYAKVHTYNGSETTVATVLEPTEGFDAFDVPDETCLEIVGGVVVAKSQATIDAAALLVAKTAKIEELEAAYNAAISADVTYNAVVFQSGDTTRQNLSEAVANYVASANTLPDPFTWRAKDNSDVAFTTTDIKALAALVGTQKTTAIYNLQTKKDATTAASTIAAVNTISWG